MHELPRTPSRPIFEPPDDAPVAADPKNQSPVNQAKCPESIEDAASAVAWTVKHIAEYGGIPRKVLVGGHSAGGYLTLMTGVDAKWLAPYDLSPGSLAGPLPVSAQVATHFHVKEPRRIKGNSLVPAIDEFAPPHHVSRDLPPICLIPGDRQIEFKCRVGESEWLCATPRNPGHSDVEFHELKDPDHSTVTQGAARVMPVFIERVAKQSRQKAVHANRR